MDAYSSSYVQVESEGTMAEISMDVDRAENKTILDTRFENIRGHIKGHGISILNRFVLELLFLTHSFVVALI